MQKNIKLIIKIIIISIQKYPKPPDKLYLFNYIKTLLSYVL